MSLSQYPTDQKIPDRLYEKHFSKIEIAPDYREVIYDEPIHIKDITIIGPISIQC